MNFPRIESTALLVVDLQERLVPAMNNPGPVLDRSRLLLRGMAELGVDVLVTEQYPKGLGGTVPEIAELLPESSPPIAKTGFSAFVEPAFRTALAAKPRKTLVVAGIEAHVCVLQTERQYRSDPEKVAMDTSVSEENYMFPTADRTAVTVVVAEM